MIGEFNYLEDYLRDFYAEKWSVPPIKLDMADIPSLGYVGIAEIDDKRKEYIERITRKELDNGIDGYSRIKVSCPKHGQFEMLIKNNRDPCDGTLRCPTCIQEKILEIDQERHKRDIEKIKADAEAKAQEREINRRGNRWNS